MALDVVCVGSATLDTIVVVPSIPGRDERVLAEAFATAGGGPAATAAVTLARLGATVGLCAVLGDDEAGQRVREGLEREGVLLDWVQVVPEAATAQSCVLVSSSTGERTIVAQRAPEPDPDLLPLSAAPWLHVDQTGLGPLARAWRAGRGRARVSIDGGNGCDLSDLSGVALYAPSVAALRRRYPSAGSASAALDAALADGAEAVVATDGSRGAHVRSAGHDEQVSAFAVPVVSTLGAGDVFHGALLAALIAGSDLTGAVRTAVVAAALSCRALDGRSAIPSRDELDAYLRGELAGVAPRELENR